jgi:hypothetical protein
MNNYYLKLTDFNILFDKDILNVDLFSKPELYLALLKFKNYNYILSFTIYKRRKFLSFNFDKKIYEFDSNQDELKNKIENFMKKYKRKDKLKSLIDE